LKFSLEESEAIAELKRFIGTERTESDRQAILELKNALQPPTKEKEEIDPVKELKSAFGKDFLKAVDTFVGEDKPTEMKVISNEKEIASFDFLGSFDKEPKASKVLSLYRNTTTRTVYIYKNGWKEFLKDGEATNNYIGGGGLGQEEVLGLIESHGGASSWNSLTDKPTTVSGYGIVDVYTKTEIDNIVDNLDVGFSGTLDATVVNVDYTTFTAISGSTAQDVFESIDRKIAGKIVLGEYKTHDMYDEGDILYVGALNASGGWYVKKIISELNGDLHISYANNYSSMTSYDYSGALDNKYTLKYVPLTGLGLG
jgi:hypothetical protein